MAIHFHGSRDSEVLVRRVFSCVLSPAAADQEVYHDVLAKVSEEFTK